LNRLPGIAHTFSDPRLLTRALTHRSHSAPHYERLEFLGDSLLNLIAAEMLYELRPHADEGDLSRLRSRLVRDQTLAEIATELQLGDHIRLGAGEIKSGGFLRASILADVVEAVIAAIYLDAGFASARQMVRDLLADRLAALPEADALKDPKTQLQEWLQGRGLELPCYAVINETGADHAKQFEVQCEVAGQPLATAIASSRRQAEQAAAQAMLEGLKAGGGS
jgi:ribonuclease-3